MPQHTEQVKNNNKKQPNKQRCYQILRYKKLSSFENWKRKNGSQCEHTIYGSIPIHLDHVVFMFQRLSNHL